jgi:hypothetical protein
MPWTESLTEDAVAGLPEDYTTNETLNRFNSVNDLAKSYLELRSMQGQSIRIPPEDAGPEARDEYLNKLINNAPEVMMKPDLAEEDQSKEFYRTMGLPEEFSGYENPDGMNLEEGIEAEMRELLYSANLTNAQYKKIMAAFSDRQAQTVEMNTDLHDSDMSQLKGKWGMTHEERLGAAAKANDEFFPGRDFNTLSSSDIEGLFNISKAMTGKGPQAAGQGPGVSETMSPDEAVRRGEEILKRVMSDDSLNAQEKHKLMATRTKMLIEYAGFSGDINQLRASGI